MVVRWLFAMVALFAVAAVLFLIGSSFLDGG
jgi:hypothetical protein